MQKKHWIRLIVVVFILADLAFSFCQYYGKPIDGDLASIVVPAAHLAPVLNDPFGFQIIKTGKSHAASNRYFAHKTLGVYFENATAFFRNFTNPIKAIYLSNAFFLWLTHLMLLLVIVRFIVSQFKPNIPTFIFATALVTPLFQSNGYHVHMGLVSSAVSYASAYAFPMALLLYFFYPLFRKLKNKEFKLSLYRKIISLPLIIILAFNGPLIPPVGILISLMILVYYFHTDFVIKKRANQPGFMNSSTSLCILFILISSYSFYIGTFNAENSTALTLGERYMAMIKNLFPFMTQKLGLPILILVILINTIILRIQKGEALRISKQLKWILIFAFLYLLLLPTGGYRSYRSGIIRHDTFIPIAIAIIYYFGLSTNYLWQEISSSTKVKYRLFIVAILLLYTFADQAGFHKNDCENAALHRLSTNSKSPAQLPTTCTVLSWQTISDPTYSKVNAELLQRWMVTKDTVLYYQQ